MHGFLSEVRKFQDFLLELGAGQSTLHLPTPRMLTVTEPEDEVDPQRLFGILVNEGEIVEVARDLFASGHFSLWIQEACKALEKYLQVKSGSLHAGTVLMDNVFGPNSPKLSWTTRTTQSERDEQAGYHRLFSGAMIGIRNPCTHEFNWVDDPSTALDILVFIQHLLRKAKAAHAGVRRSPNSARLELG